MATSSGKKEFLCVRKTIAGRMVAKANTMWHVQQLSTCLNLPVTTAGKKLFEIHSECSRGSKTAGRTNARLLSEGSVCWCMHASFAVFLQLGHVACPTCCSSTSS
jgi:hypothetical protein